MDESISSRTRSNVSSNSLNDWKICDENFKVPRRTASRNSQSNKQRKEIISKLSEEINNSEKKYELCIHELNYLQSGHTFIYYKRLQSPCDGKSDSISMKNETTYEMSKDYFINDSDDSDPEYFDSDEINSRVIAERMILNRVEELKKNNLWSAKMIPKKADPPKPTFHWDLLIKEMKWLQDNMSCTKQNKRIDARKLAAAAAKYVKEKEAQMAKNYKEETIRAKKHCLNVSKIIKEWWKQIQKIVSAKQKFRIDVRRQEAINDHLGKVIETTQKYTEWLTEDLKLITSGENDTSTEDDPEFQVKGEVTDDEETIAKDEMEMNDNVDEEIEALNRQNEMSLEDILNELPQDYFQYRHEINNNNPLSNIEQKDVDTDNGDKNEDRENIKQSKKSVDKESLSENEEMGFDDGESSDFEETLIEQEKFERKVDNHTELEIENLMKDAEVPIEELVKLYQKINSASLNHEENSTDDNSENESSSDLSDSEHESSNQTDDISSSYESSVDLGEVFNIAKIEIDNEESMEFKGQFKEISEVAMSTQPRGFTLESTEVKVQVPFLLKGTLREYQHVGLDWMAAIYEKRLNGILADEMGLGKTIQTIALLAYLSCEKGIWGPHLVVVPTSVVLNWEIEFKKWCPGFKILTYFGSLKERKEKRKGWTKPNAFHVCITSYKLAIQDSQAFKRKKWKYMILDEAQNIKNFKSQRWQTLLTFNSQRRLLLTGTPLQNNLMELWSLMHFLMPNIFQSHREFNDWFGSPLSGMIEGSNEYNEQLVMRLHKVLRPFILRRLKKDVEKQMPHKYEHLVMCPLSKRQRFLYDDYMSLSSTKEMLSSGQFMSIINILMQLRKVCNHPNLFEDRPTLSPFSMTQNPIEYKYPRILLVDDIYDHRLTNGKFVLPSGTCGLADMALNLPKFVSERILGLSVKPNLIEEVDNIHVTDWVSKFTEKYNDSPMPTSFIPRDLIDYLNKSESLDGKSISLPNPLIYGLKIRKTSAPNSNNFLPTSIIQNRREQRLDRLRSITKRNFIRCSIQMSIGTDVVDAVTVNKSACSLSWKDINSTSLLKRRTLEEYINDHIEIVDRVTFVIPAVLSSGVRIATSARSLINYNTKTDIAYQEATSAVSVCLSRIRQNQLVQFPDTRLIEYDCGKLQVLVTLLKKLKSGGHRCLIFTQMTRMLDVLEQFLSYHGYRYLRLDGTTKVEQRQIMMEQFNKDDRIFVFILSTRSGGIGVNLTGADTVIFYDSDWNPTMDAQAQDRCHRIGQTRDVHIYRLISHMTIEENILKKANEKRCLNEMAIEGGQFNMSFFKSNTLQDIFQTPTGLDNPIPVDDELNLNYTSRRGRKIKWKGDKSILNTRFTHESPESRDKVIDSAQFEAALEEVEEESDRLAAKIMRAEAKADLVEFDETVPWDDAEEGSIKNDDENKFRMEMESQLENFNSFLNPLQKFGVYWIEQSFENVLCSQLEQEETQIENNKQAWELDQIKALHEDHEDMKNIDEDDMLYIYGAFDPYAAQRDELEKLKKEEELLHIQELRKEEELARIEREKAAAQAWAQEQHRNALKRKSEIVNNEDPLENVIESEAITRGPKTRKIIIPRMEFPDESISNAKTISIANIDDSEQPIPSSSSSSLITENKPFPPRKRMGRPPYKNIANRSLTPSFANKSSSLSNGPHDSPWKNVSLNENEPGSTVPSQTPNQSFRENEPSKNYSLDNVSSNNNFSSELDKKFPQPRRMGRPPWKNVPPQMKRSFPPGRRMGRPSKNVNRTDGQLDNGSIFQQKISYPLSRRLKTFPRKSLSSHRPTNRSPNENIAPYSNDPFNSSSYTNPFKQTFKACENIPPKNGYHKMDHMNSSQDLSKISTEGLGQQSSHLYPVGMKRRGCPPGVARRKKSEPVNVDAYRNRNMSESTSATTVVNKKNSFKIPVKTLSGEHKLFSAPLLLMKTKPVFVITRKIEDNKGNVYTQNLTYPIECNESFNTVVTKLSSFAASSSNGN